MIEVVVLQSGPLPSRSAAAMKRTWSATVFVWAVRDKDQRFPCRTLHCNKIINLLVLFNVGADKRKC